MPFSLKCSLKSSQLSYVTYNSTADIDLSAWEQVRPTDKLYLSIPYLNALEQALKDEIIFRYLIFFHPQKGPVGICSLQILDFKGAQSEQQDELCFIAQKIKDRIVDSQGFKVLTCGNVFACGENGFVFNQVINPKEIAESLSEALLQIQKSEKKHFDSSLLLFKEFWPSSLPFSDLLKNEKYTAFSADVNMVLYLDPEWTSFDDYLNAMQAKFRTKANAAEKRSQELVYKSFTADDINLLAPQIEELYKSVVAKSSYTFGELNAEAFANFKKNLGDQFIFNGYLFNGQLVAFSTAFAFDGIMDANYVGINYKLNQQYALYPRMLYDFVRLSIERKASELRLGRTAEEMKSSIGAVPVDMRLYVRHKTTLSNQLVRPIFSSIKPSAFELRRPFKLVVTQ